MVYIIVSTVGVLISVIIFAVCTGNTEKPSEFIGISLSQTHMEHTESYSFFLRKEENGEVLFNSDLRFEDEPYEIILESVSVDKKYFDKLTELEKKFSISEHVKSNNKKTSLIHIPDKTTNTTTVYFTDGSDKTAHTGDYKAALYDFFKKIALEYTEESVSAQS